MFWILAREEERKSRAEKEQEENSALRSAQKQLTKEQKEARDKLMQQYGYVAEGGEEEEEAQPTELTPRDRRRGKTLPVPGNVVYCWSYTPLLTSQVLLRSITCR